MKEKMWKYFTANSTRVYIDVLDRLVQQYNSTKHHTCQPREKFCRDKRQPVERSEAGFGRGVRGSSPGNLKKPVLQMVQSELFLSYICQYN